MFLKKENLYHPFTKSEFGFFVHDTFSKQINTTQYLLEHINLYYQPVEEPTSSIVWIFLRLLFAVVMVFIQFRPFVCEL